MTCCCVMPQPNPKSDVSSLVELKRGTGDTPVFLFSGGDGNPHGLSPLVSRLRGPRPVIGVDFCRYDTHGQLPMNVEVMAARSYPAIRTMQPHGPYLLVGYSFGGLVAVEVARLLQEAGEDVALLGLIDTLFDQRFWPTRIFLRSQARVVRRHLAILLRLPLREMIRTLAIRSRGLFRRFVRRRISQSHTVGKPKTGSSTDLEHHCKAAMGNFGPRPYAGKIICFDAENHDDYGCDPADALAVNGDRN